MLGRTGWPNGTRDAGPQYNEPPVWYGFDRDALCTERFENAARQRDAGRPSVGYRYGIDGSDKAATAVRMLAGRIWKPALLMLHGKPALLASKAQLFGCQRGWCTASAIGSIPFPPRLCAAAHRESTARWSFMYCGAASALRARHPEHWLNLHHEDSINVPEPTLKALLRHLRLSVGRQTFSRPAAGCCLCRPGAARPRSNRAFRRCV